VYTTSARADGLSGFAGHDDTTERADGFIWLRHARRHDDTTTRPSFGKKT
jgi:hypothetical protein